MSRIFAFVFMALCAVSATAQEAEEPSARDQWEADRSQVFDAADVDLNEFVWIARPVIVFADSPNDPRFLQQLELLADRPDVLAERDVLVVVDTDPVTMSDIRTRLRPRGFMLVIMGKDGEVELRKPAPWDVREISRSIDKMPLRQQEIDAERGF